MTVIGELALDLAQSPEKVIARLFAPEQVSGKDFWICRFEIGAPINEFCDIEGSTSLQALALALQNLSAALYGSEEYKSGALGILGDFGGYLTIPAPRVVLDIAPYPF
jgi:hypothetical protein